MNRAERRRQQRQGHKRALSGIIASGPSPSILPVLHHFIREHQNHVLCVYEDMKNTLTLSCVDCEDQAEIGEG